MNIIYEFLGEKRTNAFLSLHGITSCDMSGKFNYKSKEHCVKLFPRKSNDTELLEGLVEFQNDFKNCKILEKFICPGYLREKDTATSLNIARWMIFKRSSAKCQKLPPPNGAFENHLRRAFIQIKIWLNEDTTIIPVTELIAFGLKLQGNTNFPETTDDYIALYSIINLISCECKCNCVKRCGCLLNGLVCTDSCGCGDIYENTDSTISFVEIDENDEKE